MKNKASDLHLCSSTKPHVRIDGDIIALTGNAQIMTSDTVRSFVEEIMPEINKEEFDETGDTDFAYETPEIGRFRVNIFLDTNGVGAVFREIPTKIPSADEINLPESIRKLAYMEKGLVVVTAPDRQR